MILLADGGSTKCDWILLDEAGEIVFKTRTEGLNPAVFEKSLLEKRIRSNEELSSYKEKVDQLNDKTESAKKVVEINKLEEEVNKTASELELLIDMVSNLKIEDATQTTKIIDNISAIYSNFNQIKAGLNRKRKSFGLYLWINR